MGEPAARHGFEFADEELNEEDLGRVAGGTTAEALLLAANRRTNLVQTLSNVLKRMEEGQYSVVDNLK